MCVCLERWSVFLHVVSEQAHQCRLRISGRCFAKNAEEFAGVMTEESSDSPLYIPTKNDLFRGIAEGPK